MSIRPMSTRRQANLETADINLSYTDINSPIDGRISKTNVNVGNLVDSNTGTLATVTSVDPIYVSFYMGEKDLIKDREAGLIGNDSSTLQVSLTLTDGTKYPSEGKISYVGTSVEEGSDSVELRATFDNPKNVLIPGQFVNVSVKSENQTAVAAIPQPAIQLDSKGHYVYVVGADNKVERRDVVLGRQSGTLWEVTSGLKDGEQVVVQGLQRIGPDIDRRSRRSQKLKETIDHAVQILHRPSEFRAGSFPDRLADRGDRDHPDPDCGISRCHTATGGGERAISRGRFRTDREIGGDPDRGTGQWRSTT